MAAVLGLTLVSTASAGQNYFLSRTRATIAARATVQDDYRASYDASGLYARCNPYYEPFNSSYTYHQWRCMWSSDRCIGGVYRIVGRNGTDADLTWSERALRTPYCV